MSRRPGALRSVPLLLALLLSGLLAAGGCTESTLTGPLGDGVDEPTETREVFVRIGDFAVWRDTIFEGYALPTDVGHLLVAESGSFEARGLLRYEDVSDSVEIDSVSREIERFENAEIRFALDSAGGEIPEGGIVLRLMGLARPYDADEVTWERAADGEPWTSPGGDFTRELARRDLTGVPDSLVGDSLTLSLGEATDSLLSSWAEEEGGAGIALLVEGPGARLRLTAADLEYDVRPVGLDTVVSLGRRPFLRFSPITFMFDPPAPPVEEKLRVGGLPAHRIYFSFLPPESVDGVPLKGSVINRADLVFVPSGTVPPAFALRIAANVSLIRLVLDPFVYGGKTPIGGSVAAQTVQPDSLSAEVPLRFDLTDILASWASAPSDSVESFDFGVRYQPDAQALGYLEFGSDSSGTAIRPYLRLIVTPPADLEVP